MRFTFDDQVSPEREEEQSPDRSSYKRKIMADYGIGYSPKRTEAMSHHYNTNLRQSEVKNRNKHSPMGNLSKTSGSEQELSSGTRLNPDFVKRLKQMQNTQQTLQDGISMSNKSDLVVPSPTRQTSTAALMSQSRAHHHQ